MQQLLQTVTNGERDADKLNQVRMMLRNQVPGWHFPMIKARCFAFVFRVTAS
jgi:hypothetical protein